MEITTRECAGFTVRSTSVSDMENNVYLLTAHHPNGKSGTHVLVDAADDFPAIQELIADAGGGNVEAVLTTHRHRDHVRALREVAEKLGATTVAGVDDAAAIEEEAGTAITETVDHLDVLAVAGLSIECIALRGHTPGSIAFVLRDEDGDVVILSGDSLFPGGPGKTWSKPDFESLLADLSERVFDRFDDALVLPGHGDATTLDAERPQLPYWRERGW